MSNRFCNYYQAKIKKEQCWLLVSILRSFDHMVFDRTVDKENSIFEFFVTDVIEPYFLEVMDYFSDQGIVFELNKKENRLKL